MPPNKDDDPTKSSDGTPAGEEDDPSPGEDPATEGPKDDKETLESIASRMVQSSMDQSIAHVEQGQFGKLNPKVVQLLTAYDKTTRPASGAPGDEEADPYADLLPSAKPDRSGSKPTPLEEKGRQAVQQEIVGKIKTQVEDEVIEAMWADDIRALFAELQGQKNFTEEDWKTIDFTNRRAFPLNRQGYATWQRAANALRVKVAGPATGDEDEDEDSSALAADRTKAAGGKKQPNPASAGAALTDIGKATQRHKEGKLGDKEYIEVVRKGTGQGVLD